MYKPTALWNAMKTCRSSKSLGDALRKIGRQEVELDEYAQYIYDTIVNDNEWMEEQIEQKHEQDRLRQARFRQRKKEASEKQAAQEPQNGSDKEGVAIADAPSKPVAANDIRSKGSDEFVHVDRQFVNLYFKRLRLNGKPKEESAESVEEEFWQYLVDSDFKKGDGMPIQKYNMHSTYAVWVGRRRKERRQAELEAKQEAERKSSAEQLDSVRQRRLMDEEGRDD